MPKHFYVTTASMYANAKPHIGHVLEWLYADVLARHYRQQGVSVWFATGTDEHGQKIARAADKAEKKPQEFVDMVTADAKALAERLCISYDRFVRSSDSAHEAVAQAFWRKCVASGDIYKKAYSGLYCVGCESFKTEKDLVEGLCPDHKVKPEYIEEENYFFKLSAYTAKILEWYQSAPVYPDTKFNEIKSLVEGEGLEDVSISRSRKLLTWGVPVPDDADQVMYVWFDALTYYLTALGYPNAGPRPGESWQDYWPATVQIIGKEINRFHAALWPAMLMSAGLQPPRRVAVHGWIMVDGQKMSKSVGNVLDPVALIEQYGLEPVRYFLLREIPFERDGDFSHARFQQRYSADLANDLGNLLSRSTNMIAQYFHGDVARMKEMMAPDGAGVIASVEQLITQRSVEIGERIEQLHFDLALVLLWESFVKSGNLLIDQTKPWQLAKEGKAAELARVLYQLYLYLDAAATHLAPFMPQTAEKMLQSLHQATITKAEPLFPRLPQE